MKLFVLLIVALHLLVQQTNSLSTAFSNSSSLATRNETVPSAQDPAVAVYFTSNVTEVQNGVPFTITCQLDGFNAKNKNYEVTFYKAHNQWADQLAEHKVFGPSQEYPRERHLFKTYSWTDGEMHAGQFKSPTFEVIVQPKTVATVEYYWCKLFDRTDSFLEPAVYKSNIWIYSPVLEFTMIRNDIYGSKYTARCTLLEPTTMSYPPNDEPVTVKYYAANDWLATYTEQANRATEFVPVNGLIDHGDNYEYPTYDIRMLLPLLEQNNTDFYCTMQVGSKVYTSSKLQLPLWPSNSK